MSDLKSSISVLFSFILLVLGIAQVRYIEKNVLNFNAVFFVLFAAAIISEILFVGPLIKRGVRISVYLFLSIWAVIYGIVWLGFWRFGSHLTAQELIIQFILVELAAGLAYNLGRHIGELDKTLEGLATNAYPNRTRNIQAAQNIINDELTRCRRYQHPLALLLLKLERVKDQDILKRYVPLERDVLERFANAKIGQIINELSRSTDIILRDRDNQFILLCPETDLEHLSILAERISSAVSDELEAKISWGYALFPHEALNFNDLLQIAKQRVAPVENSRNFSKINEVNIVK
jgi:GGDEF domain-containing protein